MEMKEGNIIIANESAAAEPRPTAASRTDGFDKDGVTALLEPSPTQVPVDLKALFLGMIFR